MNGIDTVKAHSPKQVKRLLHVAMRAKRPVMIWGAPGHAKTHTVYQFSEEVKKVCNDFPTAGLESVDLRGLSDITADGFTKFCPPDSLPKKPGSVFFIDDITNCHPQVMTGIYKLVHEGKIGDYTLPEDTFIVMAGNRVTDKSYVNKMPRALALRLLHIVMAFDIDEWLEHAIENDFDIRVIAFGKAFPKHISAFDPNAVEEAQAVPRTWEYCSDCLKVLQKDEEDMIPVIVESCVGRAIAMEFSGFMAVLKDLPDVLGTLNDPATLKAFPANPSAMFAYMGALVRHAKEKLFDNFMELMRRAEKEGLGEFAMMAISDAIRKRPELKETAAYIKHVTENQDKYK